MMEIVNKHLTSHPTCDRWFTYFDPEVTQLALSVSKGCCGLWGGKLFIVERIWPELSWKSLSNPTYWMACLL